MQEEVNEKVITLTVQCVKLTGRVLANKGKQAYSIAKLT